MLSEWTSKQFNKKVTFSVKRVTCVGIKWQIIEIKRDLRISSFVMFVVCCKRVKIVSRNGLKVSGKSINSNAASSQIFSIEVKTAAGLSSEILKRSSNKFGQIFNPLQSVTKVERIVPTVL